MKRVEVALVSDEAEAPHTSATKLFPAASFSSRSDNQHYRRRVWFIRTLRPAIQSSSVVHRVTEIHKRSHTMSNATYQRPPLTGLRVLEFAGLAPGTSAGLTPHNATLTMSRAVRRHAPCRLRRNRPSTRPRARSQIWRAQRPAYASQDQYMCEHEERFRPRIDQKTDPKRGYSY
jgi:hypothetical protein